MNESLDSVFVQLINENAGIAHRVARIYFGDPSDREDVVQEMMYQLWKAYAGFGGRSKFSTWMYSVCLNTALTYHKRNRLRKSESIQDHHQQMSDRDSEGDDERSDSLFKAIAQLTALNKAIILLYLEDMSYDEIAEVTGLTKSNVSVRLVRIKKELEEKIKKEQ